MSKAKSPSIPEAERIEMLRKHVFGFGEHFGETFSEVPMSYLLWILRDEPKFRAAKCDVMLVAVEEVQRYINN